MVFISFSNTLFLFVHVLFIGGMTLFALRMGKEALISFLSLLMICMNLFILKQVTLFGLEVTCTDALTVGYLLGMNLIQEFFGRKTAQKTIGITFFIATSFTLLCQAHLLYIPNSYDQAHDLFSSLLSPMPRIILASLVSFFVVQFLDLFLFSFLNRVFKGKFLAQRAIICVCASQTVDVLIFTFIGLYGIAADIIHVMILSLLIRTAITFLFYPFAYFSKKIARYELI
jgi:uncharacterized integral membrane protein (TIGR00697 family)